MNSFPCLLSSIHKTKVYSASNRWAIILTGALEYLQAPSDNLQQQEVLLSSCQKQKSCLTECSKTNMEHCLNGGLHGLQVNVTITVE